ncbi:MAG: hypothetical protein N2Z72_02325 [Bacteroidales bacterium]|nr:hypothetical protein [Bacteroidales bacterium]
MKKNLKDIDSLFRERLLEYEYSFSIPIYKVIFSNWRRKRKKLFLLKTIGWFSLIMLIALIIYLFFSKDLSLQEKSISTPLTHKFTFTFIDTFSFSRKDSFRLDSTHKSFLFTGKITEVAQSEDSFVIKQPSFMQSCAVIQSWEDIWSLFRVSKTKLIPTFVQATSYAAVISPNNKELFFTSRRGDFSSDGTIEKENIFLSRWDSLNHSWTTPVLLPPPVYSKKYNTSAIGFWDNTHLLFYQDDGHGKGDIYMVERINQEWGKIEKLPYPFNSKYLETSLALSPDGNLVVFTSDRPGGSGGLDLWYSIKQSNGKWSEPINMGSKINTPQNEEGISFHPTKNILFFHSDGHQGFGGYDVYFTLFNDGVWSTPINMGKLVNSAGDDVYFVLLPDEKTAYFSTGTSRQNVHLYQITFDDTPTGKYDLALFDPNIVFLELEVESKNSGDPIDAHIMIENENGGIIYEGRFEKNKKISIPLRATRKYLISCWKKGYVPFVDWIELPGPNVFKIIKIQIKLDSIQVGKACVLIGVFEPQTFHIKKEKEKYVWLMWKTIPDEMLDQLYVEFYEPRSESTLSHMRHDQLKRLIESEEFVSYSSRIKKDSLLLYYHKLPWLDSLKNDDEGTLLLWIGKQKNRKS